MKDATLNIKLSKHLYDAVKVEAEKHKVPMAAYVRAVLARQIFGKQTSEILGENYLVMDKDGGFILDM
jgi:hypothetical protein